MSLPDSAAERPQRGFATTRWSLVLAAGDRADNLQATALEQLCKSYWYPLYAYARRRGQSPEGAADATQEFFVQLLERQSLQTADPELGRFRTFLLTLFQRFLANNFHREHALKRGGGVQRFSIDAASGESRYQFEPTTNLTPEQLFERRWALELLEQVLRRLEAEYQQKGKVELFAACKPLLAGGDGSSTAERRRELKLSETAFRVALHRLRERYRELLHEEILHSVASPEEAADELRRLREAVLIR